MSIATQQKVSDVITHYRPAKHFSSDSSSSSSSAHITSLDFDDSGEFLVSASSDDYMTIYDIKEGTKQKSVPSKKYGVHLARFTHHPRQVLFASTKENDALRLLELHTESFIRYFAAHTSQVSCLALSPGADTFLSCGTDDNLVCLWDLNSRSPAGKMKLTTPYLAAFDPSATVMALASPSTQMILMYDVRNFDKAPFLTFDMQELERKYTPKTQGRAWTKLEFSNDGSSLLLGTDYHGHFLLNSGDEGELLKGFLTGKTEESGRAAPVSGSGKPLGQGDACFSQDGRYVLGGLGDAHELAVWDCTLAKGERMDPVCRLASRGTKNPVVAVNPRFNMLATADTKVTMWLPQEQIKRVEDA